MFKKHIMKQENKRADCFRIIFFYNKTTKLVISATDMKGSQHNINEIKISNFVFSIKIKLRVC